MGPLMRALKSSKNASGATNAASKTTTPMAKPPLPAENASYYLLEPLPAEKEDEAVDIGSRSCHRR